MAIIKFLLLVCASAACVHGYKHEGSTIQGPSNSDPVAVTQAGSFRGAWQSSRRGRRFQAYRGIRYAQPPTGKLRFEPPVDVLTYSELVDARAEGPACPMPADEGVNYVDEDCLRINVYTPDNNSSRKLPVVFYIHPGGYYSMTGRSDLFGPHYLMDRDIVLVAINYRLASLGFISTGDKQAPGNNGLKDQVSALRWVRRNIAAFGGDENKVTIAGCSVGSFSVMLHMISPMSKGLFHRGIAMSGSPIGKELQPHHQFHLAVKQAQLVGCPTNSSQAILDCLRSKPWQELGESLARFWDDFGPVMMWLPVVEPDVGQQRFLTEDPAEAIKAGRMHTVPLIISQTEDEFFWKGYDVVHNKTKLNRMNAEWDTIAPTPFTLPPANATMAARRLKQAYLRGRSLENNEHSARQLGKIYSDSTIGFSTHRMANLMCRHSKHPVWYYLWSYIGNHSFYEDEITKKPVGAAHHDDQMYVFPLSLVFPEPIPASGTVDAAMVEKMTAIWYTFAKYGDPNPHDKSLLELTGLSWPAMKPADRKYLDFNKQFSVKEKLHEDQLRVWEELYPIQY